jgi:hypothetical protein
MNRCHKADGSLILSGPNRKNNERDCHPGVALVTLLTTLMLDTKPAIFEKTLICPGI